MDNQPGTARAALITELLGDVGALHDQIKLLPAAFEKSVGVLIRDTLPSEANAVMDKAATRSIGVMAEKVAEIAEHIAGDSAAAARNKSFTMAVGALAISALIFGGTGYLLRVASDKVNISAAKEFVATANARADAAEAAAKATAAAAIAEAEKNTSAEVLTAHKNAGWAATEEGKLAKKFFDSGAGLAAVKCKGEKWEIKTDKVGQRWCIPKSRPLFGWDNEQEYGWRVP